MVRYLFFFILLCNSLFAQNQNVDSLLSYARTENMDSLEAEMLLLKAMEIVYSTPENAKDHSRRAITLSSGLGHCALNARSYNTLGVAYDVTSAYDSAVYCYNKALELARGCNENLVQAQVLNNLGLISWNKSDYAQAINYYDRALKIFEKESYEKGVASILSNISLIHIEDHEYEKALSYQKRAEVYRKKLKDYYGLGVSYANMGSIYEKLDKLDSARIYFLRSVKLKDSIGGDEQGKAINYSNMAVLYKKLGNMDTAIFYSRKALAIFEKLGDEKTQSSIYFMLGGFYMDIKNYKEARIALRTGRKLAGDVDFKRVVLGTYERESTLDTIEGDYVSAYRNMVRQKEVRNQIFNIEKEKVVSDFETKYEVAQNEKELAENRAALAEEQLKVRNRTGWVILMGGMLLIVGISATSIYRQQKLREEKVKNEARWKEELARVAMQSKVQEERVRISRDLHDHIGSQLTVITSSLDKLAFTEKEELRKQKFEEISDYSRDTMAQLRETIWAMNNEAVNLEMFVAKLREYTQKNFGVSTQSGTVKIENKTSSDIKLGPSQTINLFRICQEAINNAMKYAGFENLYITISEDEKQVIVRLKDDGAGFDTKEINGKGFGIHCMQDRAKDIRAQLDIISAKGEGTLIEIKMEKNHKITVQA